MVERLTIDHIGQRGDGVALGEQGPLYIAGALAGEVVEVEQALEQHERRLLLRVEQASPQRITPFCTHFGVCGGCAIQHWDPHAYQQWKKQLVVQALNFASIACHVDDLIDAHGAGRRRVTLHARESQKGVQRVGFAAAGRHDIVPIDRCPVLAPALDGAIEIANAIAELLGPIKKPLDIQVTATSNGLDIDIRGSGPLQPAILAKLAELAAKHNLARVTRHAELVIMRRPPCIEIGGTQVTLPAGSFMQPTAAGEDILARLVMAHCSRGIQVADLFSGFGPFALRLAKICRVAAFDSDEAAIAALLQALKTAKGIKPMTANTRDLFRRPLMAQELRDYDCVVFDPPRQGAEAQSRQIAASKVTRAIAVSCNPVTFARDARILIDSGFRLESVTPVDQFRHTPHVELVACFNR